MQHEGASDIKMEDMVPLDGSAAICDWWFHLLPESACRDGVEFPHTADHPIMNGAEVSVMTWRKPMWTPQ